MFFLDILVQSGTNMLQKVPGATYRCRLKTFFTDGPWLGMFYWETKRDFFWGRYIEVAMSPESFVRLRDVLAKFRATYFLNAYNL